MMRADKIILGTLSLAVVVLVVWLANELGIEHGKSLQTVLDWF